jgi:hypothetical protein
MMERDETMCVFDTEEGDEEEDIPSKNLDDSI